MSESDIQRDIVDYLRAAGWLVVVFSENRAKRKSQAGWVDWIAFRHGVTVLGQTKKPGGKLTPAEAKFEYEVRQHLWSTLRYVEPVNLDDVIAVTQGG